MIRYDIHRTTRTKYDSPQHHADTTQAPQTDGRWTALLVLCAGFMMIILDSTIVNVALPSIQEDLGFTQSTLAWVVNGYLIAFGGLLLLSGRLGDLVGQRKIFLIGLVIFTVASVSAPPVSRPIDPPAEATNP